MEILRDRMIEEMKLRNFSPATQESYVYAVSDWPDITRNHRISEDIRVKRSDRTAAADVKNNFVLYCLITPHLRTQP
jgi:hypothetical protein